MIEWTRRAGGIALRRFIDGAGAPLVLLPPHGRGPADFDAMVPLLKAGGFRIIRPEPRGFGDSAGPLDGTLADLADDVAAAIEAEGDGPAVVAGAAFGNRVARMLAVRRPELVRALILLAAGGRYKPDPAALASLRRTQDHALPMVEREAAARTVLFSPFSPITAAEMRLDDISADTLAAQRNEGPIEAWWSGGTAPMLVIQGAADVLAPPENGRSLLRDYPDRVALQEIPGGGHRVAEERPDLVVPMMLAWLRHAGGEN